MQTVSVGQATDMEIVRNNASTAQRLGAMKKGMSLAGSKATPEQMDAAASEFEAQFISQMMENMFSTVDTADGLMGGGEGEKTYQSLLTDQYGKLIAKAGGIGVADHVKREMLRMQEMSSQEALLQTAKP